MTTDFWQKRRILVTGGSGFIGSHLARRLVSLGARVSVADSLVRGSKANLGDSLEAIKFIQCDLTDQKACLKACTNADTIFHLASRVGGISYYRRHPGEVITHNVVMDALVLQAALTCGVEHYVYASSAHVYPIGYQLTPDAPPMREEQALPAEPQLSYGWAKLVGEKQLEHLIDEGAPIKSAILRLAGVYGENQDADLEGGSAIPVFIRRAIEFPKRKPFVILGTGEETRSYCYVEDVLDALLLAAQNLGQRGSLGPLNIGSEDRIKIQDLAREIIAISGKEIEIVYDVTHPTLIWSQIPDCSRAREALDGWRPKTPLREGLIKVYRHMLRKFGDTSNQAPKTAGKTP